MEWTSNNLIRILNILMLVLSIGMLGTGIWLSHRAGVGCEKLLERPVIALGFFVLLLSLAGLFGSIFRVSWLLGFYLLVMFFIIVFLFCFTVFAFVVTTPGAGEIVSGRGYKDYRLGVYSHWFRKRVGNQVRWRKIRSCLMDGEVCRSLQDKKQTFYEFIKHNLSPTQSGCCKPPTECNFTYRSQTVWDKPGDFTSSSNSDCNIWANDPSVLCYDCQSCKAGVVDSVKIDWKKASIANIFFLIFLVVIFSVGCRAFRHNRHDDSFQMLKGGCT